MPANIVLLVIGIVVWGMQSWADEGTTCTLYNSMWYNEKSNDDTLSALLNSSAPDSQCLGGAVYLRAIALPSFTFLDPVQADGRCDIIVKKQYAHSTRGPDVFMKEAFIDLLFFSTVGMKSGIINTDLGYNSRFYPFALTEIDAQLAPAADVLYLSEGERTYKGIPSVQMDIAFPPVSRVHLRGGMIAAFSDYTDIRHQFVLQYMELRRNNTVGTIVVVSPWYWNREDKKSAMGFSCNTLFPWEVLFSIHALTKNFAYMKGFFINEVNTLRYTKAVDLSLSCEKSFEIPAHTHRIKWFSEYYYRGNGLDAAAYDNSYTDALASCADTSNDVYPAFEKWHTFSHYAVLALDYQFVNTEIALQYEVRAALPDILFKNRVSLSKRFSSGGIRLSLVHYKEKETKYEFLTKGVDWKFVADMSITM